MPDSSRRAELVLRQVRDVAGDFLGAQLGVARHDHQLLDVDRGVAVFGDHAFADEDRVLEVVAVPGHERDQHVLAERQLADVGRGAVGDDVLGVDLVAALDDRALVDVRVLVRALVLDQVVDVDADLARHRFLVVDADDDAVGVDVVDDAAALGGDDGARVLRGDALDAGADERLFRTQRRNGLALHVRAHERAVRIVVLEERHQRGGDRDDLRRRDVHVLDPLGRGQHRFAVVARRDQLVDQLAFGVERGARLGDDVLAFLDGRQVVDLVRDLAVGDPAVRRLEEAVLVELRVQRQRVDQADVRAFRRLDRADPAVVRRVHVADFEAGALAGQAARAQGRDATLVRDLAERVGLVHELAQLRRAEEFLQRRRDRLRVDQVVRHQGFGLGLAETLLDRLLDPGEAGAVLVLGQLADATHPAIAEVVDVVDFAAAVAQLDQDLDDVEDVLVRQRHRAFRHVAADPGVELHPADARQVVGVGRVEQAMEQGLDRVFGRRLAGPHHAVDGDARRELVGGLVGRERLRDVGAFVELVGVERGDFLDAGDAQLLQHRCRSARRWPWPGSRRCRHRRRCAPARGRRGSPRAPR